ncbi:hypothetical protein NP493_606g01003 [Ridgeia piscesae]|uniref:Uncharacterized protein n=1 Tax=Ridgeia piscesae TaxID=27915 RepID=A0AAD9KTY0_RIDPI|nr:hypothetical protein NP493_606g01003 [Ridgeia piscesae]
MAAAAAASKHGEAKHAAAESKHAAAESKHAAANQNPEATKDRKALQEEALRRFLNIGCKLTDFHQKCTSKRWTTPISPFLYQNIYPTTAPCGFASFGRHARCFDMYHMHLQTMHKKAWIQSCENRNQAKTMELTFFRENLKKASDGNLVVDMKKRPKTAPMTVGYVKVEMVT